MRRLVMRHEGNLPLVTVEHIWREIITTFTAMQAPFGVAAGPAEAARHARPGPLLLRVLDPRDELRKLRGRHPARGRLGEGQSRSAPAPGRADGGANFRPPARKSLPGSRSSRVPPARAAARLCRSGRRSDDRRVPDIRVFSVIRRPDGSMLPIAIVWRAIVARSGDEILIELPIAAELAASSAGGRRPRSGTRGNSAGLQPIRFVAERTD